MTAIIEVNDLFDDLREEKNKLLKCVQLSKKLIILLEKYRKYVNFYRNNCKCSINNKHSHILNINCLDNEYKRICNQFKQNKLITNKNISSHKTNSDLRSKSSLKKLCHELRNKKLNQFNKRKVNANKDKLEVKNNAILGTNNPIIKGTENPLSKSQSIDKNFELNLNKTETEVNKSNEIQLKLKRSFEIKELINKSNDKIDKTITKRPETQEKDSDIGRVNIGSNESVNNEFRPRVVDNWIYCQFSDCDFKSHVHEYAQKHYVRIHKNKEAIVCNICKSKFWGRKRYCEHIKECSIGLPFVCNWPECDQAFKSEWFLKKHSVVHTGVKPYVCEWPGCDSAFFKISLLTNHQICAHTIDKPYVCEWPGCDASFKLNSGLTTHRLIHSGVRKFVCNWNQCGKSFINNYKLSRHYRTHSKVGQQFDCDWPQCRLHFKTQNSLDRHLLEHKRLK